MNSERRHNRAMRDPIDIWSDLLHDAAEQAAEDSTPSDDDRRWARDVEARVMAGLVAFRRRSTPRFVPMRRGVTIPADIKAMDHGALVSLLERMRREGNLVYAFHDLRVMTDHDLQTLLTAALNSLEG
ncbi:MAG: hypothetical protein ABIY55_28350 [Kofleriaceae bacterium]